MLFKYMSRRSFILHHQLVLFVSLSLLPLIFPFHISALDVLLQGCIDHGIICIMIVALYALSSVGLKILEYRLKEKYDNENLYFSYLDHNLGCKKWFPLSDIHAHNIIRSSKIN